MRVPEDIVRQSEQRARQLSVAAVATARRVAKRLQPAMERPAREAAAAAIADGETAEMGVALTERGIADDARGPALARGAAARMGISGAGRPPARDVPGERRSHLSFAGARPSVTELERTIGTNDLVDEFYLERALVAARPVCRLIVRDASGRERGYATGFMVSPRLLLTNWHVFRTKDEAANGIAEFDFKLDVRGDPVAPRRFLLEPEKCYLSDRDLDYALVAVSPTSTDGATPLGGYGYHRLIAEENKIEEGEWITIIQHPGGQRRQFSIRENQLLEKQDPFLWYASDTAQGSSGAPAFNDSFQIVALHHSGKARRDAAGRYVLKDGSTVTSLDDVEETDVVWEANEGLRISRLVAHITARLPATAGAAAGGDAYAQELADAMSGTGGDIMTRTITGGETTLGHGKPAAQDGMITTIAGGGSGGLSTVQLNIATVNIATINVAPPAGGAGARLPQTTADSTTARSSDLAAAEKMVEPIVDPDYGNREGYDEDYLGVAVPMPTATDKKIVAKMEDGEHVIPYEHFSVVVNKKRRMALFTASNVDGRAKNRSPGGGSYSRDALGGLGKNDTEKWVTDPRIPEQHQLPDAFYTKDRKAFDKGHIVRRDDVCWGTTRKQIVRANGDTFHTTNCSPQVKGFNQSSQGGIWGELENEILKQAKTDTYCLFAGPVLDDANDEVFEGVDDRGKVEIRIPSRYWKVVVDRNSVGDLEAFAFVLEQDLSKVKFTPEEFVVTDEWRPFMVRISELEGMLTGVRFPQEVKDADQFAKSPGDELVKATKLERLNP